jgi:hypothetical protein
MKVKQLSLFLENQPGALNRPVAALAKAGVNILTLQLADTREFGILRLIVEDPETARKLLEKENFVVKVTDMVAIQVADAPGGLASILEFLVRANINLEYMYGFTGGHGAKGILVFRFDDPDRAIQVLKKKKINPISGIDLFKGAE